MQLLFSLKTYLSDCDNTSSLSSRLRKKRIKPLVTLINKISAEKGKVEILDIGGTRSYWNIAPPEVLKKTHITLLNTKEANDYDDEIFRFTKGNGCDLEQYDDNHFDIAHSNSVIEHVGNWENITQFASELKRVAQYYYVQTPNFFFPLEPHFMLPFFHWLPESIRVFIIMTIKTGCPKVPERDKALQYVRCINLLKRSQFKQLFPEAMIVSEKIAGVCKSFYAIKDSTMSAS
ncbi:methyltransferase domain-containing protein [Chitinispirillales bacterium ANBcel5]|uniref:methyltransferase domain-containing protein n=1 Tax=Cellulosispirillum alkaliphilum TaxID=3039283 RepID=UPI002A4FBC89|nr:methyltransferase domain-containing protein [Chitinispirillales bacterium ANBcel5]